jgi:hypothetical protein
MGAGGTGCQREECSDSKMPIHDLDELKGEIYFIIHEMKLCTKTQAIKCFFLSVSKETSEEVGITQALISATHLKKLTSNCL